MARLRRLNPPFAAFGASMLVSILLLAAGGRQVPEFHDEFSYLLAADTFASGRLTNRAHPMARFFETFGVIHHPTYMSRYPPGQGLALALGQLLGDPMYGAWLSTAAGCAAVAWMLGGAMPRRWALAGGLVCVLHPTVIEWSRSYWGAGVSMAGGALLAGALVRAARVRRLTVARGAVAGVGLMILANTRPYEGAIFGAVCSFGFVINCLKRRPSCGVARGVAALVAVLVVGLSWTAYYNWRGTGKAWDFPYLVYERTYAVTPALMFLPQPDREPAYSNRAMRDYYMKWELGKLEAQRSLAGFARAAWEKVSTLVRKFWLVAPALLVSVLPLPWLLMRGGGGTPPLRCAWIVIALMTVAALGGLWFFAHYAGPYVCVILFVMVQGARHVWAWRTRGGRRAGAWVIAAAAVGFFASSVFAARDLVSLPEARWGPIRADIHDSFEHMDGKFLVFVRAMPDHSLHSSWVYNPADIDRAKVVWAHDLGADANRDLLAYYPDRTAWLVRAGPVNARIDPYTGQ
jgi:hypothetical protein